MKARELNVYSKIINHIFEENHHGRPDFEFGREEIVAAATLLDIKVPKNPGDVIYSFRYRNKLPKAILDRQPEGLSWIILGAGAARYRFRLNKLVYIYPTVGLRVRKIPDATPEIISQYALTDEQALLAKIRYNRLIDIFLGVVAYSLQNHLRTTVENYGQIEIDELYVAVDTGGVQFIVPVQAKAGKDVIGVIQTIQDTKFCKEEERYQNCIPRTVSAQFMADDVIALFELDFDGDEVSIVRECHYKLTEAADIKPDDLQRYRLGN